MSTTKRRRADGEETRAAILEAATQLATTEGLDGLSIGRLADHIGMSKSGLYAHFGSKEELQLAAIDTASVIFADAVIRPAREPETAFERLESLCEHFFRYLEQPVFPGGCFFASAAAELDTHPGPVKERLAESLDGWMDLLERRVREAQEAGEFDPGRRPGAARVRAGGVHEDGQLAAVLARRSTGLRATRGARCRRGSSAPV